MAKSWGVRPGELFPTRLRATGHGISAGIGKLGAFIGVFLFPVLQTSLGLRGTLLLTAGIALLGALLTLVLPEPAGRSLEEISRAPTSSARLRMRSTLPGDQSAPREHSTLKHLRVSPRVKRPAMCIELPR